MKLDSQKGWLDIVGTVIRWLVGAYFIYMGLSKALHPVPFLKLVRQYEVVHAYWLLNSIAAALPWFEVFCGALLLAGIAVRGAALVSAALLAPFTILVLRRALQIAALEHKPFMQIKFDCGCGAGEVLIWHKMIENGLLLLFCLWLLLGRGKWLSARFTIRPGVHPLPSAPVALSHPG
jgi:uncharacterized membrane protein YphA (DoxX/SURF4 family)